jgi:N-acetylneuraminic acid mutarotase
VATNAAGRAAVGSWTLGIAPCANTLTATAAGTVPGNPVTFAATATDCWSSLASLLTPRQNFAGGVISGYVHIVGGYSAGVIATHEVYDPQANTWFPMLPMPTPRYGAAAGVVGTKLYVSGGSIVNNGPVQNVVEGYDAGSNTWSTNAPMPTARRFFAVGVVGGILYAVGGEDGTAVLNTMEAYDPRTNTWSTKAPMPTARAYLGVQVVNGIIYAIGGNGGVWPSPAPLATVEAYDPVTNSWSPRASMPTAREGFGLGELGGRIVAFGGDLCLGGCELDATEVFDPLTNVWSIGSPLPAAPRAYGLAASTTSNIYYIGGESGSGWLGRVEGYIP